MKVVNLEIDQEVTINVQVYKYKGVQKVNFPGVGKELKIVFEANLGTRYEYKYFDITVGKKELKEVNGQFELK